MDAKDELKRKIYEQKVSLNLDECCKLATLGDQGLVVTLPDGTPIPRQIRVEVDDEHQRVPVATVTLFLDTRDVKHIK